MLSKLTAGFTSQIVRFDLINGIVQKWIWYVSISCLVFVWFSAWGVFGSHCLEESEATFSWSDAIQDGSDFNGVSMLALYTHLLRR